MSENPALRWILASVGGVAGLAYYILIDEGALRGLPIPVQRLVIYFFMGFFPAFGLMAGPLSLPRAATRAGVLAAGAAILATWAGTRFDVDLTRLQDLLEPTGEGLIIGPFLVLGALSIPVLTAGAQARGGWREYQRLLPLIWTAVVKGLISVLFVGLFWAIYFLSNQLLELVGIDLLEDLIDWDPGPYILSGIVTGIALAVACELDHIVGTILSLVLRLLRLLLVPVAAVLTVFILATLFQGLDTVFANRSAAATMMVMAAGATVLIAAALNFHDAEARTHPAMQWSARVLGAVLPVVAGIAVYAMWLRVDQYGWTPVRLLGVISAGIVVLFTLPVTWNALPAHPGWQARTLGGFVWALLASLVIGACWFTPLLNAQRITAQAQLQRLVSGRIDAEEYDFWPLAREWGTAGQEALAAYLATSPPEAVRIRIEAAQSKESRWQAGEIARQQRQRDDWAAFRDGAGIVPPDEVLPQANQLDTDALRQVSGLSPDEDCGTAPSESRCIAVRGEFVALAEGEEWMLVAQAAAGAPIYTRLLYLGPDGLWRLGSMSYSFRPAGDVDAISALRAGDFRVVAPRIQGLEIGNLRLMPTSEDGR